MEISPCPLTQRVAPQLLTTSNFIGPWYHAALLFLGLGSIVLLFGVLFSQQIREVLVRAVTSPHADECQIFQGEWMWRHGGLVVSVLDFRSEVWWLEAQSLPLGCFLRQETLPHIVSLHPGV